MSEQQQPSIGGPPVTGDPVIDGALEGLRLTPDPADQHRRYSEVLDLLQAALNESRPAT